MNTTRKIIRLLKQAPVLPANEKLLSRLQKQIPDFGSTNRLTVHTKFRRVILPITIAAAAVLIMAFLGYSFLPFPGTAYGIADLPEILSRAKTLHITGQFFVPGPAGDRAGMHPLDLDYWFDAENGRYRLRKPSGGIDKQTGELVCFTTVSDGRYIMEEVHHYGESGERKYSVRYRRLSPYQAKLDAYRNSYQFIMRLLGSSERLEGAVRSGSETINGMSFDIWRNEWFDPNGRGTAIQVWLSRETGSVGRITLHTKAERNSPDWTPYLSLNGFEINANPPEGIFLTEPPAGYGLLNTKEDAPESELGIGIAAYGCREYGLFLHIGFTLRDGSVLAAWSCRNENSGIGSEEVRNLEPGDPLPSLPAVIDRLEPRPGIAGLSYTGYHFVSTEKNGIVYEWALYIPNRTPPSREEFLAYRTNIVFSIDRIRFKTFPNQISDDISVDTEDEFEKWIGGAFTELSDTRSAPKEITYASLLKLSTELKRASVH